MFEKLKLRHNLIGSIFVLYLLPIVLIAAYGASQSTFHVSWVVLSIGLLLSSVGTLIFYSLLYTWEEALSEKTPPPPAPVPPETIPQNEPPIIISSDDKEEMEKEIEQLKNELETIAKKLEEALHTNENHLEEINYRNQMIQQLTQEKNQFQREIDTVKQNFQAYQHISEQTLELEKTHSIEYQETISELRSTIEHKQQQIEQLDHKIRDLTYEIKTLLQLADLENYTNETSSSSEPSESSRGFSLHKSAKNYLVDIQEVVEEPVLVGTKIRTSDEAKIQLKRCIDIAQKITGSHHFGAQKSRFGDLYLDNYALDLRRLCDNLRSENSGTVLVYSPKDNKLLFINNQIKNLLGWSPEKFVQDFENIIQGGMFEWKNSISQMNSMNNTQSRLVMKTKTGEDKLLHCQLGLIPTGVFRNNIIGVLYSA
jgi:ElaB/YqjD/DUF883 family membrane-anchored ribosome-binding protein